LIGNYLLDEKISEEERKERFEIAWDIWKSFKEIKLSLKQRMLKALMNKISSSNEFRGYEVRDGGIEGEQCGSLIILFKKDWLSSGSKIGVLNYVFDASTHKNVVGIMKQDKGIPFEGDWRKFENNSNEFLKKCSEKCSEICDNVLGRGSRRWKVSEWCIAWKWLEDPLYGMWEKEFYLQIMSNDGIERAVNCFFDELLKLKKETEGYIDKFIEFIKIHLKAGIEG